MISLLERVERMKVIETRCGCETECPCNSIFIEMALMMLTLDP